MADRALSLFDDLPVPRRAHAPAPLRQPEGRSAQYWSAEMVRAGDADRKAYCYAMMLAALLALDHSGAGH